jgi:hypothetical protein
LIQAANATRAVRSETPPRLPVEEFLLQRLARDLEHMAPALRQLIQAAHAMVRQRHLPRQGHLAPTDQPHVRDRLRRGATRAGRDQRRAGAGEASDAVEARGLDGFGQAHGR